MRRLTRAAAAQGLTLVALSEEIGATYASINNWSDGRTEPSMTSCYKLCQVLKIDFNELYRVLKGVENENRN